MTGKERVINCFNHKTCDRTPWVPYTGVQVGSLTGYTADKLLTDTDKLYESLCKAHKIYSPDGMPVVFDLQMEAETLGCKLMWDPKTPPKVSDHPLMIKKKIPEKIPSKKDGRLPITLSVMNKMAERYPDTAFYGLGCGPLTLASHLRGTNIFLDMIDDPDYVKKLLDYCKDVFLKMSQYFREAGMTVIAAVDPMISQISSDRFRNFMADSYSEIFKNLKEKNIYNSFFVCGDATKNIEEMCKTGPDCISIDENIDIASAKKITDKYNIVISGNLQLTVTMRMGSQLDNQKAALDLIDTLGSTNFILAPGCDIPYNVPKENLIAIAQTVQNPEASRKALKNYTKKEENIEIELPDYKSLRVPLIELITLDSASCAACGYMVKAAKEMEKEFSKITVKEYKITEPENVARMKKLGVMHVPTMLINGKIQFVSTIPSKTELKQAVKEAMKQAMNQ